MKKFLLLILTMFVGVSISFAQATSVNGGSIEGTITDASGAAIPNATVLITTPDTGYSKTLHTDGAGFYSLGPLNPGPYTIHVSQGGFENLDVKTVVRTGTSTNGTFKLTVGKSSETVEVNAGAIQVNTDQVQVADVITQEQIDTLPVNGRNFLDVAQIEPGVILQQGSTFDPTKTGYSAISVSGVGGRTTRILLDGQDISDEFVGTTIFNVSEGSIGEFQLSRSTQDVSGEVTSTGQVLVSTRSGTNAVHGMAFYNFQDARALFAAQATPQAGNVSLAYPPFQRNQYGGSVGGPILKDKLFYFANLERIQQRQSAPAGVGSSFTASVGGAHSAYASPYKDTYMAGRLDYNGPFGGHYFVRGNYNFNGSIGNSGRNFQLFTNRDNTYGIASGADFARGHFTHSFRGSYEKFHNFIGDATAGNSGIYDPIPSLTIYYAAQTLWTGPNPNAPQGTFQSDKQLRYDGTYTRSAHQFKFGASMNRIQSAAFAAFYGLAPRATLTDATLLGGVVTTQNPLGLGCNGVVAGPACSGDLINGYNTSATVFGNNQGYGTNEKGFGLPGGAGNAWRMAAYIGDSWKMYPNLTVTAGVRWSVDTNRENNDLDPPTCGDLSATFSGANNPCGSSAASTSLFTLFNPAYSGRTHQPYANFSPQIGMNYSPGSHKTSYRAGFGLFFESVVFNNTDNARGNLLKFSAAYSPISTMCSTGTLTFPDGTVYKSIDQSTETLSTTTTFTALTALCKNQTVAQSAPAYLAIAKAYQANTKANSSVASSGYLGTTLSGSGLFAPNYKTPYSEQWNVGVQHEIFRGAVISADYVHNTTLKIGQTNDINHLGAARNFNLANATTAVNSTLTYCNVATVALALTACKPTGALVARAATIADFASRGLDSQATYVGASPAVYAGKPNAGAFTGNNPLLGNGAFIQPIGKSAYDALQVVFRGQKSHPIPYVDRANVQASYSLSRIVSTAGAGTSDQFFTNGTTDKDNPNAFIGRSALDHTHQLNLGGSVNFKYGLQMGLIAHFYSAQPATLTLDTAATQGGIFQTDVTGDGTVGDVAPGSKVGNYMHGINGNNLSSFISNFNSTQAGKLTPAGQAVVNSGLITAAQMVSLQGAIQPLATMPNATALQSPAYRNMDMSFSYPVKLNMVREGLSIEPSITFYNIANFSNFGGAPTFTAVVNGVLTNQNTSAGAAIANGCATTPTVNCGTATVTGRNDFTTLSARRTTRGTGTFDQGAPRSAEFGLKVNF